MIRFLILLFLTGCQMHAGLALHSNEYDNPTYNGNNPLGVIRLSHEINNTEIFYEHVSSIPDNEEGYGLNMTGILIKIK